LRTVLLVLCLSLGAVAVVAPEPAHAGDDVEKEAEKLRNTWKKALLKRGIAIETDNYGNLLFERPFHSSRLTWVLQIDGEDPEFMHLLIPNVWPIEDAAELERTLEACNTANAGMKVVKLYVEQDTTMASIELLLDKPKRADAVLDRVFTLMDDGLNAFLEAMTAVEQ